MKQEEKELLLRDLSARLPYGVIVRHADPLVDNDGNETGEFWYKRGYLCDITTLDDMTTTIIESEGSDAEGYEHICFLDRTVPFLRPMSSITEEEEFKLNETTCYTQFTLESYDWLNAHYFDYRGLIEKGLAIEAPKGMYKID